MKQKTKIIFLLLLVTGTLFVSCNLEEEYASEKIHQDNMSVYHKNFNELLKNNKFIKAYSKVLTKKSQTAKTAMEEQYQFTIANNLANVVEGNNEISYTLLIQREVNDPKSFENLVIISDSLNNTSAYIIKYSSTNQINTSNFNPSNSEFNKQITPIIYNPTIINESSKEAYYYCYDIMFWVCTYTGHTTTGVCTHGHYETVTVCEEVIGTGTGGDPTGDSGSSSIDGSSSDGGGGGSATPDSNYNGTDTSIHGNGGTPITTAPIIEEEIVEDPCDKLKNLFNTPKPDIKSTIQNHLQTDIPTNPNGEKAAYLQKLPDGTMGTTVSAPTTTNNVKIRIGTNYYSAIHTHPNNCYPMFSYSDVVGLNNINNNLEPHNEGLASFMLVCQDEGVFQTYAIVFETSELNNSIDYFLNTPRNSGCTQDEVKAEIDILLGEEFANDSNYERVFLKFMAHTNVSIYKANSELTNWNKLTLGRGFNDAVNSTPCN